MRACVCVCVCVCLGPECGAGCHHGFCEQSGECRCRAGWRGAACDQCVPSPDCVHGACEEPGQCVCERGWTGARCDREVHRCSSKPCSGNSTCVETGGGGHVCLCAPGHTGENCQLKKRPCSVNRYLILTEAETERQTDSSGMDLSGLIRSSRCQNGGTKLKHKTRVKAPGPAHAFHKLLLRPAESDPLVTRSQIICFSVLGLLTCLVILVTTGIVFFNRCETWMANAKYSQLVRQQRDLLLRASDREQHSLNIILPEKIKLSSYSRHYTSI
uniref:Delta like non-canonical Notch ligand 1 n=1 Tax=Cyprinus carpio carpio TaxID=630221 RepID=A0A8C1HWH0_CYPCA